MLWERIQKAAKSFLDDNFNSGEDFVFFAALIMGSLLILVACSNISYQRGIEKGQIEGFYVGIQVAGQMEAMDGTMNWAIKQANDGISSTEY